MSFLMSPLELVRLFYLSAFLAIGQVWANKMRSFLTTLGIIIGVASVTAVVAALTGLKSNVLSEFETFGTNKMYIWPDRPETGPMANASWRQIRIWPEQTDGLLDHCPSVSGFTRLTEMTLRVEAGNKAIDFCSINGIEPAWHKIENRSVTIGRPFDTIDQTEARQVCLINEAARDKLQLDLDCVGETILIDGRRFLIVGVLETRTNSAMFGGNSSNNNEIFIPFSTSWKMQQNFIYVVAASKSPERTQEAAAEIRFFFRNKRNIRPGDPDTFQVEVIQQYLEQFDRMSTAITMVAGGVVAVSLLVGGIGIMNIMLVSVSERTREIGLRKAVGAKPSAILLQFLVEAIMLCLLGGGLGLLMGWSLAQGMAKIPGAGLDKAVIPAWAVAMSFGFAAAVGVVFGMFPAIKASRLDPIEALRHE